MRTTQAALEEFEASWQVRFSREEVSLIAVIFGAWLMQKAICKRNRWFCLPMIIQTLSSRWSSSCAS